MIYKKEANFPYPLLTNTSDSYESCQFILDINLEENTDDYQFTVESTIESSFIQHLIGTKQAKLILVIQSKDNKFYDVKLGTDQVIIPKTRLSLSKRTTLQLLIQSQQDICFKSNDDLNHFYDELKQEIVVPKYAVLGFSNCVVFDGSQAKPFQLFEKKLDPELKSEIAIDLGSETIIISYKNEQTQFNDSSMSSILNNPYVYMGLQKAMYRYIVTYGEEDNEVDLEQMEIPEDGLDLKLYQLMSRKMVKVLNTENIDEVINLISDKMLQKFTSAVRGLYNNEN